MKPTVGTKQSERRHAPQNRTLALTQRETEEYRSRLIRINQPAALKDVLARTICQDIFEVLPFLPSASVDLLFADPPYNLDKTFNGSSFKKLDLDDYECWVESWLGQMVRLLKPTASVYVCCDWRSSAAVHRVCSKHLIVRNRITWERDKGRGAESNWKNCAEDIWFCTKGHSYTFNVESVKLKRRILAPYSDPDGSPRGWVQGQQGKFRLTYPSNMWTDVTVPFWSMPENTEHPTQKAEKLLAKVILASSQPKDVVFDPFLGSGTTSVVAKKLNRNFFGVEIDPHYCCLAEKRLANANVSQQIQGYVDNVFWERNSIAASRQQTIKPDWNIFGSSGEE